LAGTLTTEDDLEQTVSKIINGSRKNAPNFAELKVSYPFLPVFRIRYTRSNSSASEYGSLRVYRKLKEIS
jgi:hypothetical protein